MTLCVIFQVIRHGRYIEKRVYLEMSSDEVRSAQAMWRSEEFRFRSSRMRRIV